MAELVARGLVVDRFGPHAGPGGVRAIGGVDIQVEQGELVAIMGGTGAGKSSLALALAGLVEPSAGVVDGAAVGAVRMVLQRPESTFLAEHVLEEVMLAPVARGAPPAAAERHARAHLEQLGIDDERLDRDVLALSGGEQRRVAVAAALAADARVLVLDEPGAGLDRAARAKLHDTLRALHAAGRTIVLITHDSDEAAELATRLVVLRDGLVAWDGPAAAVLADPARAAALGIATAPEVEVLHAVAAARGVAAPRDAASARRAIAALVEVCRATPARPEVVAASWNPGSDASRGVPAAAAAAGRSPLPPLVDARVRLVAVALVILAALAAGSLAASAIVLFACIAATAAARIDRTRLRLTVRPLVALTLLLVAMQLLVGGAPDVELVAGTPAEFTAAPALHRSMQAAAIVLATLVLSARTSTLDLATGIRRLLAPLAIVRVPVATIAFVTATGIGLVPAMADELDRLRLAQRARGLGGADRLLARLRADSRLVAPLFVTAFRRAHLLADALAVRQVDPRRPAPPWRAMVLPRTDVAALVGGALLVAVSRFV